MIEKKTSYKLYPGNQLCMIGVGIMGPTHSTKRNTDLNKIKRVSHCNYRSNAPKDADKFPGIISTKIGPKLNKNSSMDWKQKQCQETNTSQQTGYMHRSQPEDYRKVINKHRVGIQQHRGSFLPDLQETWKLVGRGIPLRESDSTSHQQRKSIGSITELPRIKEKVSFHETLVGKSCFRIKRTNISEKNWHKK